MRTLSSHMATMVISNDPPLAHICFTALTGSSGLKRLSEPGFSSQMARRQCPLSLQLVPRTHLHVHDVEC